MLKLGQFELFESIGKGGMGEVWRARAVESGQLAAVKIVNLPSSIMVDQRVLFREVQAMARLHHPNIAVIWDVGRVDDAAARSARSPRTRSIWSWNSSRGARCRACWVD